MQTIRYEVNGKIYLNLTNRCSNACEFCVRNYGNFGEYDLWLAKDPTLQEVLDALGDMEGSDEVVICGYGEPLYRMDIIPEVLAYAKQHGKKTRMNTNGQDSLINGGGSAARLMGGLDYINISLNAASAAAYADICKPVFGEQAFDSLVQFAKECVGVIPKVVFSIVDSVGAEEVQKAQKLADELGIHLRVRRHQS